MGVRVWTAQKLLKGKDIFMREDLPHEIEKQRRRIQPLISEARKKGIKIIQHGQQVIVEGKAVTYDYIEQGKPIQGLNLRSYCERSTAKYHFFTSRYSPLSNFFPSTFTVAGQNRIGFP